MSGGFYQLIEPVAEELGIPKENIYANRILFNEKGDIEMVQRSLACGRKLITNRLCVFIVGIIMHLHGSFACVWHVQAKPVCQVMTWPDMFIMS